MTRPRSLKGAAAAAAPAAEEPAKPGRATMKVEVSGDPDTVRSKMGLDNKNAEPEAPPSDNDKVFFESLKKAEYRFQVKRMLPREWQGRDARLVVYEDACPMLYQDIVEEITNASGGRKYRAVVFNPEDGKAVAAKTFSIEADPKLPPMKDEGASLEDLIEEEAEPSDETRLQNTFDNQIRMAEKQLNLERTTDMLESLRKKRDTGKSTPADDDRFRQLERQLSDERHQRDLDRQKADSDRQINELRNEMNQLRQGQQKGGGEQSDIAKVLDRMATMQEDSNKRFERFLEKTREDKVDEILKKIDKGSSMGGLGTLAEQVKAFRDIKSLLDGGRGGGDDDDDVDDREWWEKLIDHVPKIMDKLSDMSKGGKKVTKEDFLKEIDEAAEKATKEEIQKIELQTRRALPAPAPAPAPIPENPKGSVGRPITPPEKVAALPPPLPAAPAPAPAPAQDAAPAPAPAAPEVQVPTLPSPQQAAEQETVRTAAGMIVMIEVELETRKRLYQWNYEGAWQNCPEPLLEKLCIASDPLGMLEALNVPGLPAEMLQKLDGVKAKAAESPRAMRWLGLGHKELQRWWKKLEEDPEFDPADEEEEEAEEEAEAEPTA